MSIVVPHVGMQKPGRLPTDINNPGYKLNSWKECMVAVAKYLTAAEWTELAQGANSSCMKHSYMSHPCGAPLLCGTCGLCFCPIIYLGAQMEPKVNADINKLPITAKLKERGITVYWEPKTKFAIGGMTLTMSAGTRQVEQVPATMQVVVPTGLQPGTNFMMQAPDGQMMQVTVPPGSKEGDTIAVTAAAAPQSMQR